MNNETLLLRQINPHWLNNDRVTSQAFSPTPKDAGRLSVYDGDQISAEASWCHFTLKYRSIGVMAVTVSECEGHGTQATPDPEVGFEEHVIIDFTELTHSESRAVGKTLARLANERGWQYLPSPASTP